MSTSKGTPFRLEPRLEPRLSLPPLTDDQTFVEVVRVLCGCIEDTIGIPYTFEQFKTGDGAHMLLPLVDWLTDDCTHAFLVAALLVLRYHFKDPDDHGVTQSRAYACELLAWRVMLSYTREERLQALFGELPPSESRERQSRRRRDRHLNASGGNQPNDAEDAGELTRMLRSRSRIRIFNEEASFMRQFTVNKMKHLTGTGSMNDEEEDPTMPFIGLNALEIAAIANAKKFLSQKIVQRSINAIWNGDIMFWDSVSIHAERKARYYNKTRVDPYCRLRVPKYQKIFETAFLTGLLVLYFVVMQEDKSRHLTPAEILLYIWIAAFTYEEIGSFFDTGMRFYTTDLWNFLDVGIVGIALAFVITRAIGLTRNNLHANDLAFDILSLMAIPLVPRTCGLLSLNPYFGILIPSLTQMTRDVLKFLVIVVLVYSGFFSTFVLLARNAFTAKETFWLLIYVFNGSGYLGLDNSNKISKAFGPTLMVIFVCITNILLLPTLISLLTTSLTRVIGNAREEFLFQYSILVLESCASKRLTYFLPPLNLIPLVFLRPLRLLLPADQVRSARIVLLKLTHAPFVSLIMAFEKIASRWQNDLDGWRAKGSDSTSLATPSRHSRSLSEGLPRLDATRRSEAYQRSIWKASEDSGTIDDLREIVSKLAAQVERLEQKLGE